GGRVEVRVVDRDCAQAAALRDHFLHPVEERGAIPEHAVDEERALPDGERRLTADPEQPAVVADLRSALGTELPERRPALPVRADVLALVEADRAARRRLVRIGVLDPTCLANPGRHDEAILLESRQ